MFDWNDIRYFLAVADSGSTTRAARQLGANQTTVARRIASLEEALDLVLFERRQSGYRLTEAGKDLLEQARHVRNATDRFAAEALAARREVSGTVRITSNEIYSETVLPPLILELKARYPALRIELDHSHERLDLGAGEADVALRTAVRPEGDALVARRIVEDRWTFFCSREYAQRHGRPRHPSQLADHALIGGGGHYVADVYRRWLATHAPGIEPTMSYDSSTGLLSAVRAGLGIAVLPLFVAADDPNLIQCFKSAPRDRSLWLVTHERVRNAPHVRAVMDALGEGLAARAKALAAIS